MANNLLIPIAKAALQGQAKQILRGAGLSLLKPLFFNLDTARIGIENETYIIDNGELGFDKYGVLGLPVWDTVQLTVESYTTEQGTTNGLTLNFDIALLEVSNPKNVVKTSIAGRNGTVKEYMSNGDYNVKINGSLFSQYENTPPIQQLKDLRDICEAPVSITVDSNMLLFFNITYLVIENYTIKQREGTRNVVDFELICSSDTPFELNVTNA
jgi:hypothetical protein